MPRHFPTGLDLEGAPLNRASIQNLGSPPSNPITGQVYTDTSGSSARLYVWDGTAWRLWATRADNLWDGSAGADRTVAYLLNFGNTTGTRTHTAISDFDSQVRSSRLDQMATPAAPLAMGGQPVTGLPSASTAGQAVEYAQFESTIAALQSGLDIKETQAAVVATTNVSLAAPGAALNGHTFALGDSLLLTAQSTGSQNGLYTWNGASAALTRRTDANTAGSVLPGTMVVVGGTDNANPHTVWMQTAPGTGTGASIVLDTDAQTWVKPFSTTIYAAGNGIDSTQLGSGTIAVDGGTGISVTSSGVAINPAVVPQKVTGTFVGTGAATSFPVTHNLNNTAPHWSVYIGTQEYDPEFQPSSANAGSFVFSTAPGNGVTYTYTLIG